MLYKIFYVDTKKWVWKKIIGSAGGKTFGFIVFIRKEFRDAEDLKIHELEHVRQFWAFEWFRDKCYKETKAYMKQRQYLIDNNIPYREDFFKKMIDRYCKKD